MGIGIQKLHSELASARNSKTTLLTRDVIFIYFLC
jgi:hypothetical protein